MEKRKFNARVQHKIDTYENWGLATNFPPLKGEIVIYTPDPKDPDDTRPVKIKVGDGTTLVGDLDFIETASAGGAGGGTATPQIQSDWLQENSSKKDYIKNRPFYKETPEFDFKSNFAKNLSLVTWDGLIQTDVVPILEFFSDTLEMDENIIYVKVSEQILDFNNLENLYIKISLPMEAITEGDLYLEKILEEESALCKFGNYIIYQDDNFVITDNVILANDSGYLTLDVYGDIVEIYIPETGIYFMQSRDNEIGVLYVSEIMEFPNVDNLIKFEGVFEGAFKSCLAFEKVSDNFISKDLILGSFVNFTVFNGQNGEQTKLNLLNENQLPTIVEEEDGSWISLMSGIPMVVSVKTEGATVMGLPTPGIGVYLAYNYIQFYEDDENSINIVFIEQISSEKKVKQLDLDFIPNKFAKLDKQGKISKFRLPELDYAKLDRYGKILKEQLPDNLGNGTGNTDGFVSFKEIQTLSNSQASLARDNILAQKKIQNTKITTISLLDKILNQQDFDTVIVDNSTENYIDIIGTYKIFNEKLDLNKTTISLEAVLIDATENKVVESYSNIELIKQEELVLGLNTKIIFYGVLVYDEYGKKIETDTYLYSYYIDAKDIKDVGREGYEEGTYYSVRVEGDPETELYCIYPKITINEYNVEKPVVDSIKDYSKSGFLPTVKAVEEYAEQKFISISDTERETFNNKNLIDITKNLPPEMFAGDEDDSHLYLTSILEKYSIEDYLNSAVNIFYNGEIITSEVLNSSNIELLSAPTDVYADLGMFAIVIDDIPLIVKIGPVYSAVFTALGMPMTAGVYSTYLLDEDGNELYFTIDLPKKTFSSTIQTKIVPVEDLMGLAKGYEDTPLQSKLNELPSTEKIPTTAAVVEFVADAVSKFGGGTIDTTVKEGSNNAVSGGAVFDALQNVTIETVDTPDPTSNNPISSKGIYDIIGNYKIRVSDKFPDENDDVDDFTITFVI